jgi:hypothetical protein
VWLYRKAVEGYFASAGGAGKLGVRLAVRID